MRDFSLSTAALALNTATLGHNMPGAGAGWSAEQTLDACARRGIGGIVFWRPEIGTRATQIGQYAQQVGVKVVGLCRAPFLTGPLSLQDPRKIKDDFLRSIDETSMLNGDVLTIVVGGVEAGTKGVHESLKYVTERVADVLDYAASNGVRLALEPLHPMYGGTGHASPQRAMRLIYVISLPLRGLVWRLMCTMCGGIQRYHSS